MWCIKTERNINNSHSTSECIRPVIKALDNWVTSSDGRAVIIVSLIVTLQSDYNCSCKIQASTDESDQFFSTVAIRLMALKVTLNIHQIILMFYREHCNFSLSLWVNNSCSFIEEPVIKVRLHTGISSWMPIKTLFTTLAMQRGKKQLPN